MILKNFGQKNTPVRLSNCAIQKNKLSGKLEVALKGYTEIEKSSTMLQLENIATLGSQEIPLRKLPKMKDYDKVTVRVKILRMLPPENNKSKQELFVSDATAVANVTIWQEDINKFKLGASYQLNRFSVRSYRGKRHLSFPPSGVSFQEFEDIGEVVDESGDLDSNDTSIEGVTVVGVYQLEKIYTCFNCKKGSIEVNKNQLGTCKMAQVLREGKFTAKLFLEMFDCESHVKHTKTCFWPSRHNSSKSYSSTKI